MKNEFDDDVDECECDNPEECQNCQDCCEPEELSWFENIVESVKLFIWNNFVIKLFPDAYELPIFEGEEDRCPFCEQLVIQDIDDEYGDDWENSDKEFGYNPEDESAIAKRLELLTSLEEEVSFEDLGESDESEDGGYRNLVKG